MSMYCKNCINAVESNLPSEELFCKIFPFPCDEILMCSREPKLPTNADHIRAMTDEELAEFLQKNRGGCRALTTESYVCDFYMDDLNTDCKSCWLDWLKEKRDY